jgi:hypothetical protein
MQTRRSKKRNNRRRRNSRRRGLAFMRAQRGGAFYGGLNALLPTTTWGEWASNPAATAWGAETQAPAPLANGGLYNSPQSTGAWASSPMPATQHAFALEAAKVSGLPEVAYHQGIAAGTGNNFSPYVHAPLSSNHYSAGIPPQQ